MSSLRSLTTSSSLRSRTTRFATALALVASLSAAASAHVVRAPHMAPPPGHFAQPPHAIQTDIQIDTVDRAEPAFTRDSVRAALARARARNLAAFHAYATAGVYPSNVYQSGALNVWRDQDGHFCAAATIIRASGQIALTDRVADQNNNIKLADVTAGPLMDWILTSGLTQDEIVLIQRPFMPVTEKPEPAPTTTVAVDAKLRAAETARLEKLYALIETKLAKQTKASLDAATDRLMHRPDLAWKIASAE